MKILIISPGYFPTTRQQGGAIEKLIDNFLEYNENIKKDIEVYSPKISSEKYDSEIYQYTKFNIIDKTTKKYKILNFINKVFNKISIISIGVSLPNLFIKEVVRDIKRKRKESYYDLIIFENGVENINYFHKHINGKVKLVLHLHNDYLNIETKQASKILKNCSQVWTVSNYIKSRVDEIEYIENKVKVLSNPLDKKIFDKNCTKNELIKLKKSLGINDEFVFIYTGRVIPAKGVKELIQAFNFFNIKNKKFKLLIVGGDQNYLNRSKYLDDVKKIANDNVIFTGFIPVESLYKYYKIANAQIVPSMWNEAFGLILLEGMYFDLPIIATNSGGMPEICEQSAYLVERKNIIEDLVTKMEYLINNPIDSNEKKKKYNGILNKFTLEKYCTNFDKLINELYELDNI